MILKRVGLGLFTLLAISLLITVGVEMLTCDVCIAILGQMASEETVAACAKKMMSIGVGRGFKRKCSLTIRFIRFL